MNKRLFLLHLLLICVALSMSAQYEIMRYDAPRFNMMKGRVKCVIDSAFTFIDSKTEKCIVTQQHFSTDGKLLYKSQSSPEAPKYDELKFFYNKLGYLEKILQSRWYDDKKEYQPAILFEIVDILADTSYVWQATSYPRYQAVADTIYRLSRPKIYQEQILIEKLGGISTLRETKFDGRGNPLSLFEINEEGDNIVGEYKYGDDDAPLMYLEGVLKDGEEKFTSKYWKYIHMDAKGNWLLRHTLIDKKKVGYEKREIYYF